MFTKPESNESNESKESNASTVAPKYKNIIHNLTTETTETSYSAIDQMLEKEKQHNKTETWNKLDKTIKIQKLHQFAEKYGKEHALPMKEVKSLKAFFLDCLEKNKLQKTKDVIYDKEKREITSIPALHFNTISHNFTLKIIDTKRVSTLKSLTPKRVTEKNKDTEMGTEDEN
jgi:hypothetical protein